MAKTAYSMLPSSWAVGYTYVRMGWKGKKELILAHNNLHGWSTENGGQPFDYEDTQATYYKAV